MNIKENAYELLKSIYEAGVIDDNKYKELLKDIDKLK